MTKASPLARSPSSQAFAQRAAAAARSLDRTRESFRTADPIGFARTAAQPGTVSPAAASGSTGAPCTGPATPPANSGPQSNPACLNGAPTASLSTPPSAPAPTGADISALLAQIAALSMDDPAAVRFAQGLMLDSSIPAARLATLRKLETMPGGVPVDLLEQVVASSPLSGPDGIPAVAAYQVLLKSGEPSAAAAASRLLAAEPDPTRKTILSQVANRAK